MVASRIVFALALAAGSLVAFGAFAADEEVVAASRPAPLPTEAEQTKAKADLQAKAAQLTKPLTTEEQVAAWTARSPKISRSDEQDDALWPADNDDGAKRQVHGVASVTVGTGGYRSAYVSSLIPLGETGTLGIAVSQTDYGKNGGFGYYGDPYGYDDYGYGYGRGWGRRGGTSQSVGLSLDMTGQNRSGKSTPEGCAPGFRDGDRYVEPVWVTRMNGNRDCETAVEP